MKKHVVWQPQIETDAPLNPFVPPERRNKTEQPDFNRAHLGDLEVEDEETSPTGNRLEG